jgi:transcriptional regulator with XRE-family HTH domain
MDIKEAFAAALKQARKNKGLTQEDFSNVSSRTYVSTLERGLKAPTIDKVEDLTSVIGIHPLTLLTLTYMIERNELDSAELFGLVTKELSQLARL